MEINFSNIIDLAVNIVLKYGLKVFGAIAILIFGWIAARWIRSSVKRGLAKIPWMDGTLRPLIANILWWIIIAFVCVAVLNQFGVQTTSIIAVLGAAGLAVGLALQGTLSNVAAGVMLLILRPFKIGDFIEASSLSGLVMDIGLFTSELKTADGVYIMVPNSNLWNTNITNYSRNRTKRIDLEIGISYEDDLEGAMDVLRAVMVRDKRILADPPPQTMVTELADSSVNIRLRCWCSSEDSWHVPFDLRKNAKLSIEEAGYTIPFQQHEIRIIGDSS